MKRDVIFVSVLALTASLASLAPPPQEGHQVDINVNEIYGGFHPKDAGHNVALYLGNGKTLTPPPTDNHGHTKVTLPILPEGGVALQAYLCANGKIVLAPPGVVDPELDKELGQGCELIGTIPLNRFVTGITFYDNGGDTYGVVVDTHSEGGTKYETGGGENGGTVNFDPRTVTDGHTGKEVPYQEQSYTYKPDPSTPGTFYVSKIQPDGSILTYYGVKPEDVGLPWVQYELVYPNNSFTTVYDPPGPQGAGVVPVVTDQVESTQDGTTDSSAGPAPPPPGQYDLGEPPVEETPAPAPPATKPGSELAPSEKGPVRAALRANRLTPFVIATLMLPAGEPFASLFDRLFYSAIPQAPLQKKKISYSLVANGNSSGPAFTLSVTDPSGRVRAIALPQGTVLEPTGQKLKTPPPPPADSGGPNHSVSSYCLQFHKQPQAPGMLFRIAGPDKQQANEPAREVLTAIDRLYRAGKLHPDIEVPQYLDAIRQYAVWSRQENWDEKAFTENWIERTRKNAQNLNVKWTRDMEKSLRSAAPGRWSDIGPALEMANNMERVRKLVLSGAPPSQKVP